MSRGGFTLVELLLVVLLLMLLAGASILNFSSLQQASPVAEGASRLESLVRFARAHAANTGRKVQLSFVEDTSGESPWPVANLQLTWEPDPLGTPGVFEKVPESAWHVESINELVQIETVRWLTPGESFDELDEAFESEFPEEELLESFVPITFYPDGSSDSAEIVLVAQDLESAERLALRLEGITGTIQRKNLALEGEVPLEEDMDMGMVEPADEAEPLSKPAAK